MPRLPIFALPLLLLAACSTAEPGNDMAMPDNSVEAMASDEAFDNMSDTDTASMNATVANETR